MTNWLIISREQFLKGYSLDIQNYVKKDYQGNEYLPWYYCYIFLKELHPNLIPELEVNDDGTPFYHIRNETDKEHLDYCIKFLEEVKSKLEGSTNNKEQKQLSARISSLQDELLYGSRGIFVKPYLLDLETNKRTPSLFFPVMGGDMNSALNPDSRELSDNIQRAIAKCIATFTGISLPCWTQDKSRLPYTVSRCYSMALKVLDAKGKLPIYKQKKTVNGEEMEIELQLELEDISLTTPSSTLTAIGIALKKELDG